MAGAQSDARGRTALTTMNVVELKRLASGLGITGTTKMRKDDLVAAISGRQVASPHSSGPTGDSEPTTASSPQPGRDTIAQNGSRTDPTHRTERPEQTGRHERVERPDPGAAERQEPAERQPGQRDVTGQQPARPRTQVG
ncbi:MAG: Rho termination factor N-terminal domain-containing protein, partial [Actinomycetota bacterium]|nr:Rho termination factor N-terminal domain-containing protein [Actinomycetota bacterium]